MTLKVHVKKLGKDANVYEVGQFVFVHGQLQAHRLVMPDPAFEIVVTTPVRIFAGDPFIDKAKDPEVWIRALPFQYCGSYLWCELEELP